MNGFMPKTALDVLILVVAAAIGLPLLGSFLIYGFLFVWAIFDAYRDKLSEKKNRQRAMQELRRVRRGKP